VLRATTCLPPAPTFLLSVSSAGSGSPPVPGSIHSCKNDVLTFSDVLTISGNIVTTGTKGSIVMLRDRTARAGGGADVAFQLIAHWLQHDEISVTAVLSPSIHGSASGTLTISNISMTAGTSSPIAQDGEISDKITLPATRRSPPSLTSISDCPGA